MARPAKSDAATRIDVPARRARALVVAAAAEHDRQQRERHRHGERRPAAQQRDAHPDRRDPQPDDHPRQEQRPRRPPPREQVHAGTLALDAPVAHPHDPARARRDLRAVGDHDDRLATGVELPEEVEHLRGASLSRARPSARRPAAASGGWPARGRSRRAGAARPTAARAARRRAPACRAGRAAPGPA